MWNITTNILAIVWFISWSNIEIRKLKKLFLQNDLENLDLTNFDIDLANLTLKTMTLKSLTSTW